VFVAGDVNPDTGFVQDFADVSRVVKPVVEALDHRHLGQWCLPLPDPTWGEVQNKDKHGVENMPADFYPSSENLLWWIAEQLHGLDVYRVKKNHTGEGTEHRWKPGERVDLEQTGWLSLHSNWTKVALEETCTSYAELTREEYDDRAPKSVAVRSKVTT
jgi:6-pyruvoyl-tetrahydropterin synthase